MTSRWLLILLVGCTATTHTAPAPDADAPPPLPTGFFVAPGGDDAAPGTIDAPFATVQRAVEAMRASDEKHTYLRAGLFELRGQPIALDARDNGIELLAYPGEAPVISGGTIVTGWTQLDANIWAADLPDGVTSVGTVTVDGAWYEAARTPNRVPGDPQAHASWFFVDASLGPAVANPWDPSFGQDRAFTYRGDDLDPSLAIDGEPDAWIMIWDKLGWSADTLKIESIDHGSRAVQLASASQFGLGPNSRYYVYGVRSALDAPGEYYVDEAAHRLLLIPRVADPSTATVAVAAASSPPLISIDGADGVRISGLELRDGGGVTIASGTNIVIDHDVIHALTAGIDLEAGTGNRFDHDAVYDIAGTGVTMYGDGNTVSNCDIHDAGLVAPASHGVLIGPGRNVIAHNHLATLPHDAIMEVGDRADGLVIEYNVIEATNLGANDTGAIYLKNRGNYNAAAREAVRYNKIIGSGGLAVADDTSFTAPGFSFAVYLDDGQSGTDVYGNLIIGASSGAVFPHNGTDNHIYDNVIIDGVHEQLFIESSNSPAGNVFESNILVSSAPTPTLLVKYEGQEATFRNNVYSSSGPFLQYSDGNTLSLAAAQDAGFDRGSIVADPAFTDPAHGDYRLQAGSPALGLGFVELPYDAMGPLHD